jgi:hypothetical protein
MRIVRPILALLLSVSMAAAVLTYMERQAQENWVHVRAHGPSDTLRIAAVNTDPHLQRYYSQSEGWTYYTLPKSSSVRERGRTFPD